jgi:methyl-accepting chemotaxis protein
MNNNGKRARGTTIRGKFYRHLIALFAVMLISTAWFLWDSQLTLVNTLMERQASDLAQSYFDSINTLMLTGGMSKREIARNKVLAREEVMDARIVRGPGIIDAFGTGAGHAAVRDALDERALAGETIRQIRREREGRVLTVLLPMQALSDYRGTNCLTCHMVTEGEILGAVRVDLSLREMDATVARSLWSNVAINSAFIVGGLVIIGWLLSRIVTRPLGALTRMMRAVAEGNVTLDKRIDLESGDEIGALAGYFNQAMGKFSVILDETRKQHLSAQRLKTALDSVSTNVMVADHEYNIIYLNSAGQRMFRNAQADLRVRIPGFDAERLVGCNIDEFHTHPERQRRMLGTLTETHSTQMEVGKRTFRIVANPIIDQDGVRLGTAVEWEDLTQELKARDEEHRRLDAERQLAAENLRIRTALDNVSSSVMMADADNRIVYMNKTVRELFANAESDLRQALGVFDATQLMGANIDDFHRNPAQQRAMLAKLEARMESEISVGSRTLRIIVNPVFDERGARLGTAVEWVDRTAEVAIEREVDGLVEAARMGDLSRRVDLNGKQGFFHQLSAGFNALLDELSSVFSDLADVLGRLVEGDLQTHMHGDYAGAFGKVRDDVNRTVDRLGLIVGKLRDSAEQVGNGSQEISEGNTSLSSRTEAQASSLQETASAMEELTSTVRHNADNAQQADRLATSARELAERGGEVVGNAIAAMDQIDHSSSKIAEIIGVIDEIAFQTNLLALNASVEAARAGEQGRGFAVVATEVRNLAGRSATAAKEIKELIRDSGEKVKVGAELVHESGACLEEIVTGVEKVGDIVAQIAAASAQQASGIDQVNQAITAMDAVTQQNAALAEETSAASASMSQSAVQMRELIEFFQVPGMGAAATPQSTFGLGNGRPATLSGRQPSAFAQPLATPAPSRRPRSYIAGGDTEDDAEWEEF